VQSTIKAIEYFAKLGVVSNICVFRPSIGTELELLSPPSSESIEIVFKRMYEVCVENNIPIGTAPNIKVSLIILPEEGQFFCSPRIDLKNFMFKAKLLSLKILFKICFYIRLLISK
jgi:hypothetical protein